MATFLYYYRLRYIDTDMIRGHLKQLILASLKTGPLSGYDIMNRLGDRLGARPSPGSVYPLLAELEKEGLIAAEEDGRRKEYSLSPKGRQEIEKLCDLKRRFNEQIEESVRMFAMLTGEKSGFHDHVIDSMKKGDLPFKELNRELKEFRDLVGVLFSDRLSASNKDEVRKILLDANRKLESVIRRSEPAAPEPARPVKAGRKG